MNLNDTFLFVILQLFRYFQSCIYKPCCFSVLFCSIFTLYIWLHWI